MATFKIGDICIFQNSVYYPQLNGLEVTVAGTNATGRNIRTGEECSNVYLLAESNPVTGNQWAAFGYQLRKKRPPESDESAARQAMLDCIERAKMGQGAHV